MRAVTYGGAGKLTVARREIPAPGPREVQVAVGYVGICGTDLHLFHGAMDDRAQEGRVIGHEMSGTVREIGPEVDGWKCGEIVTVLPIVACSSCFACRAGHLHLCHNLNFLGIDSDGAMQELWNVPADNLVRLPSSLNLRAAALVEPTAVAVHDVRRAGLTEGETTLVVGGGPIGLLVALRAANQGADVLVLEPNAFRRSLIQGAGLRALDSASDHLDESISEWTGGDGPSVAFEVSGSQVGLDAAVGHLAVRGRLVVVAIHTQQRSVDLHRFFLRELTLTGARLYQRRDFEEAVRLIETGRIPALSLVTACEPMEHAGAALAALGSGQDVMKILVDCREVPT